MNSLKILKFIFYIFIMGSLKKRFWFHVDMESISSLTYSLKNIFLYRSMTNGTV